MFRRRLESKSSHSFEKTKTDTNYDFDRLQKEAEAKQNLHGQFKVPISSPKRISGEFTYRELVAAPKKPSLN